ncbi:Wzz/FepE/Etk N-terminal domain-containing protein [Ligilactobacillus salivarius]|uniref:Capsular polysaccharide biosynthesis protein CpsC n=1 Tax=Ligilactobacillus salivarius TaxID=1624 RepID=A0ABD7YVN0_9LACO|nr:Wzz/FepE/Etk N-terminal domain-containing protein [Ligilactobacillus salivarius]WHS05450.1 Wzz/FepE/Etk N-terminal domain-containing protein [Ligilactobacillus salivarius]WHS08474.1 Wzz/FepE/Etk N-terminal domain-containing protein [Ligilactobacillus salivarius]WHS09363.1 Wzz/FepE/Etk N-terminal domain-containing protein [Ligilactobacillus salivarius]WHS13303.1 Wzz/FepE/Etk N-terminal domain-containing protein [Ligilactobacillus salivarius]WHS18075.1 Wzz/FepE/Etk N-terminal domain-containin
MVEVRRLISLCINHIFYILIGISGCSLLFWVLATFVIPSEYTATTQILVNQKNSDNNGQAYANQQADINMITTYKDIITNQVILSTVSNNLATTGKENNRAYNVSVRKLRDMITIKNQTNSQVFALNVKTDSPQKSQDIANMIALVFKRKIKSIMSVNNVTIISRAGKPIEPSFPRPRFFILAGAILGFLISFAIILINDMLDTTVRSNEFMIKNLGLTNLGSINRIESSRKSESHLKNRHAKKRKRNRRV